MLDKALSNAQERLAAKERSAVDAVALIDKCSHQQKLLQEASDNKQKLQEEHKREKSFLEKEVAQLKMQLENNGTRKNGWSLENEETAKLHKTVQSKDERITQLESSMMELQKRYNEDMQRNEITTRNETEAL
jgi:predicted RNase H-like nuclease (RuvC/YqgF family)